jgi:hypothetical protein
MSVIPSYNDGPCGSLGVRPVERKNGYPRRSIDGRIFPVWAVPKSGKKSGELDCMDH